MSECPECLATIKELIYILKEIRHEEGIYANDGYHLEDDKQLEVLSVEFRCRECDSIIATNEEEANKFLEVE